MVSVVLVASFCGNGQSRSCSGFVDTGNSVFDTGLIVTPSIKSALCLILYYKSTSHYSNINFTLILFC